MFGKIKEPPGSPQKPADLKYRFPREASSSLELSLLLSQLLNVHLGKFIRSLIREIRELRTPLLTTELMVSLKEPGLFEAHPHALSSTLKDINPSSFIFMSGVW